MSIPSPFIFLYFLAPDSVELVQTTTAIDVSATMNCSKTNPS